MENWEIIDDKYWMLHPWYEISGLIINYFPINFLNQQLRSLTKLKNQHRSIIRKYNKLL